MVVKYARRTGWGRVHCGGDGRYGSELMRFSLLMVCGLLCVGGEFAWAQAVPEDIALRPVDGANGDQFGWSVAIDDRLIAVGSWHDADNGSNSGSVYVYDAITGSLRHKLLAEDGDSDDVFSVSLDLRYGLVAVGARDNDDAGSNSGSAYLFDAVSGVQLHKLLAEDAAAGDRFGRSVAIGDGIVCVGSPLDDVVGADSGSVYVFDAKSGVQIRKVIPDDASAGDRFGFAISLDEDGLLAVCAYHDNVHGANSGSVYLFDVTSGEQVMKIAPDDGQADDQFGRTVSIDGGLLAVGADSDDLGLNSGSVYVFDVGTGAQLHKLLAFDGAATDAFGGWVRLDGGLLGVGAAFHSDGVFGTGAAYVYEAWSGALRKRLEQSDAAFGSFLGSSIDISGGEIVVGALGADGSGAAAVYGVGCRADFNRDFSLDMRDVSMFISAYSIEDPLADLDGDGRFSFFDVALYLRLYLNGCG